MAPGLPATAASTSGIEELLPNDEDLLYEEELLRNPYSLKMWWRYIDARKHVSNRRKYLLYERALRSLPGSYKVRARCAGAHRLNPFCKVLAKACTSHCMQQPVMVGTVLSTSITTWCQPENSKQITRCSCEAATGS